MAVSEYIADQTNQSREMFCSPAEVEFLLLEKMQKSTVSLQGHRTKTCEHTSFYNKQVTSVFTYYLDHDIY